VLINFKLRVGQNNTAAATVKHELVLMIIKNYVLDKVTLQQQ